MRKPRAQDGETYSVVYESARQTVILTPYCRKNGSPITVRVGKAGIFACGSPSCIPADKCIHARGAREWFATQSSEPATLPVRPLVPEGQRAR